jgi:hypothetical protein
MSTAVRSRRFAGSARTDDGQHLATPGRKDFPDQLLRLE